MLCLSSNTTIRQDLNIKGSRLRYCACSFTTASVTSERRDRGISAPAQYSGSPRLKLGLSTCYYNRGISWFPSDPPSKCLDRSLKQATTARFQVHAEASINIYRPGYGSNIHLLNVGILLLVYTTLSHRSLSHSGLNSFLPRPFEFVTRNHPTARRYIVRGIDSVVK